MSQQDHKDFFISYNGADQRWAEWIAWQLEEAAYSVILQAWDFLPGSNFVVQMDLALTLAPRLIAVLSPQYLSALYTQPEWAAAFRRDPKGEQRLLIPVRVQACEVTGLLGSLVYVDLVGQDEAAARQHVLAAVRHERAKPAQAPAFPQTIQHTISKQLNFSGNLPPIWQMPHQRDPLFLGRGQLLQELHTTLATDHHVLLFEPAGEREIGTSGASDTAVEYAYRYQSDYQVIAWIQADSHQAFRSDLLSLAAALRLPQANPFDQNPLTALVQWLRTHQHWLLVLDQVQEKAVLAPLIPLPEQGHLLVVTSTRSLESLAPLLELSQVTWEERTALMQLSQVVGAALQGPQGRIPLGLEPVTIGRALTNQVILSDLSVSSRHAIIELKDQAYWITDRDSTNGTFLNQQRLVPHVLSQLHPGATIRFGNITCTYEVIDRPPRSRVSSLSSEQGNTSAGTYPPSSPVIERPRQDRVGQRFGNYRLSRLLGLGGFAEVYLGKHIFLDTQTAIKVLYTQLVGQDVEQFRQEARTIAHLEHPHIARLLDFGVEGTAPYLIMSYAPNGTMRQRYPKGTRLSMDQVVSYVQQISEALQYAHDHKIIHRDIKPENMLFGPEDQMVLSDFGIALRPNDMAGTIAYMAPEQIEAHPRAASDQYSLGIVVYEWLCGERPFQGSFIGIATKQQLVAPPSLREKVPSLSAEIEQVVMTALAKDPKARFDSIRAFATALEHASQAVQDISSVQLNNEVLSSSQGVSPVPVSPPQSATESSQAELEQVKPLLKPSEPLRGVGKAQGEVPPRVHSDTPSHHTDEKEPAPPPLYEEVHATPSSGISSLKGESVSLDETADHIEPSLSSPTSPASSHPRSAESPSSSQLSPTVSRLILNSPQPHALNPPSRSFIQSDAVDKSTVGEPIAATPRTLSGEASRPSHKTIPSLLPPAKRSFGTYAFLLAVLLIFVILGGLGIYAYVNNSTNNNPGVVSSLTGTPTPTDTPTPVPVSANLSVNPISLNANSDCKSGTYATVFEYISQCSVTLSSNADATEDLSWTWNTSISQNGSTEAALSEILLRPKSGGGCGLSANPASGVLHPGEQAIISIYICATATINYNPCPGKQVDFRFDGPHNSVDVIWRC